MLEDYYSRKITPEQILYYIYSIMNSEVYVELYGVFLINDYPKIPFTTDHNLFKQFCKYGKELKNLHVMEQDELNNPISKFPKTGSNIVGTTKKKCQKL